MIIRREITIALVESVEGDTVGIEVTVPAGLSTLEAAGLMEVAKLQHIASKHGQGPTVYQTPDDAS